MCNSFKLTARLDNADPPRPTEPPMAAALAVAPAPRRKALQDGGRYRQGRLLASSNFSDAVRVADDKRGDV